MLSARLQHLVDHEIFERVDVGEEGERFEYRLTEKGEALLTVLTAMREWSDEWVYGRGNEPLIFRDRRTGRRTPEAPRHRRRGARVDTARPARGAGPRSVA